jgi:CsoR family transcriptional regulator, copper-sensing transcriptional repressor
MQDEQSAAEINKSLTPRLRRIEGQVQGIQRMLDSARDCEEVLTQIMAVRSSLDQVGLLLMENHIENCLVNKLPADSPATREIADVLKSWARFGLVPGARSDVLPSL